MSSDHPYIIATSLKFIEYYHQILMHSQLHPLNNNFNLLNLNQYHKFLTFYFNLILIPFYMQFRNNNFSIEQI